MTDERLTSAQVTNHDESALEMSLRPQSLHEYLGQSHVKDELAVYIQAAKQREESLDHVLLSGPPGLGKTTLAMIIANELGVHIHTTSGPAIEKPGDLVSLLNELQPGDVLFIDEIHRLPKIVEELLYSAMEDFYIDIIIGQGPAAHPVHFPLPPFTLVGATTRAGLLSAPLRDRFGIIEHMAYYTPVELTQIIHRSARIFNLAIDDEGAHEIARRSRGTPRIANRLLRRIRDFADVAGQATITQELADQALTQLRIDQAGLDDLDRKILRLMIEEYHGGPVGLNTIAANIGEEAETIAAVYEPYLLQSGFIKRTARGRIATAKSYQHLHIPMPKEEY